MYPPGVPLVAFVAAAPGAAQAKAFFAVTLDNTPLAICWDAPSGPNIVTQHDPMMGWGRDGIVNLRTKKLDCSILSQS